MKLVKREEPHVLILMGPFVDERHKTIESGNVKLHDYCLQYSDLFKSLLTAINSAVNGTHTKVLLQPSVRDVNHPYPFPQPAFETEGGNVQGISNPQRISVNGTVIQVLNADVFSDMDTYMVSKPKGNTQELVTKSLLEQGSLYPIFPSGSIDFPVDYKYESHFALSDQPDILIVQSTQPCFVYVIILHL